MKFRQTVENSTLADYSQQIVSSIINYLKGKPVEIAETFRIYLKNWLDEKHKYLGEFFKYFYDTLQSLARQKLNTVGNRKSAKKKWNGKQKLGKSTKRTHRQGPGLCRFSDYLERWRNGKVS